MLSYLSTTTFMVQKRNRKIWLILLYYQYHQKGKCYIHFQYIYFSLLIDNIFYRTKGILVCQTFYNTLIVGPTAEDQKEREKAEVTQNVLDMLQKHGEKIVPSLTTVLPDFTKCYAGLRPATELRDYYIEALRERQWITVASIRSTGIITKKQKKKIKK